MSIESLRAAREASDAALQFQQGQNESSKAVNREIGQKANQAASSKDAKARQLVQARYDQAVAQADLEQAERELERKEKGKLFAAINVGLAGTLSLVGYFVNVNNAQVGGQEAVARSDWEGRQEALIRDQAQKGGFEVKDFKVEQDGDKSRFVYTLAPAAPTDKGTATTGDESSKGVEGAKGPKAVEPLQPNDKLREPAKGVDEPAGAKTYVRELEAPSFKAAESKQGTGTKYVLMPLMEFAQGTLPALQDFLKKADAAEAAQNKVINARQKRDAAFQKLNELNATLENF